MLHSSSNLGSTFDFSHCIIGCGLSGSRVLSALITQIQELKLPTHNIRIALIEKSDNFGVGVPYGDRAEKDFLLVEEIFLRCPEFAAWLALNTSKIERYVQSNSENEHLQAWYQHYQADIKAQRFEQVYFPRAFFGLFARELFDQALNLARELGIHIECIQQEALSLLQHEHSYQIELADKRKLLTNHVLLSIGSIPRPALAEHVDNANYFCDQRDCGHLPLAQLAQQIKTCHQDTGRVVNIAVIGSSASSIETLYFLMTRDIAPSHAVVVSRSGVLPRALGMESSEGLPDFAVGRPCADTYADFVARGFEQGVIRIMKAEVESIRTRNSQFELQFLASNEQLSPTLSADIVVDCRGSGSLGNTTSRLLSQLKDTLPINDTWCGFELDENKSVIGHPQVFVLGPLNNLRDPATHVESIVGVFRESKKLADVWLQGIMSSQSGASVIEFEQEGVDL